MPLILNRICIYTKDVMRITGRSERISRILLERIRNSNNKIPGSLVTLKEFCAFTKINTEEVEGF